MDYQAEIASLVARLDAMQANERRLIDKLAAIEKEAERYRWMRDRTHKTWEMFEPPTLWFVPAVSHAEQTLDAAVDMAMARAAVGAA